MVGLDDRTWGKRPFPVEAATPVRRRRAGVISCVRGCLLPGCLLCAPTPHRVVSWVRNFCLKRSYEGTVRRFATQGIGLSLRDRPRDESPGVSF